MFQGLFMLIICDPGEDLLLNTARVIFFSYVLESCLVYPISLSEKTWNEKHAQKDSSWEAIVSLYALLCLCLYIF